MASFRRDNVWNTDIASLPVNARSDAWLGNMGGSARLLHPDFGSSGDPSAPYGIPYAVVDGSHPRVNVSFEYADESDPGPYPLGADTPIEGGQQSTGDRHALMLDRTSCTLYELYDAHFSPGGSTAGSGAVFNLKANGPLRPATWTSADAAGLPILPGLLRPDEVNAGIVNHAIRFTAQQTDRSFIWPARHQAGARADVNLPPMGARFRLQAGYDTSRFGHAAQVVLTAMKHYGLILADNGSNWFFQGAADNNWDPAMISQLKSVLAGAFEAVDESSLMVDPNSGQARQPSVLGSLSPTSRPLPEPRLSLASTRAISVTVRLAEPLHVAQPGPQPPSLHPRPSPESKGAAGLDMGGCCRGMTCPTRRSSPWSWPRWPASAGGGGRSATAPEPLT